MVFEDNGEGVDYEKAVLHAKSWDLYKNYKKSLTNSVYYVEVEGLMG